MSEFSYCPVCKEIVQGSEPCSCVFYVRGTLDDQGLLHTAKRVDLGPLAEALAGLNAETLSWVAENPSQRWGGLLVEDLAHWTGFGVTTPRQLAEYLGQCAARSSERDWDHNPEERERVEAEAIHSKRRLERKRISAAIVAALDS